MKRKYLALAMVTVLLTICFAVGCEKKTENENEKNFTITFMDGETVLQSIALKEGTMPVYDGEIPARASTAEYDYVFSGWNPQLESVTKDAVYTAQFISAKINGFQSGDGSQDDPYVIVSSRQLKLFSDNVNEKIEAAACYALDANINLNGTEWTPIGKYNYQPFSGYFDGKGFKISNYKISNIHVPATTNYSGLFGYNEGTIKNLGVEGLTINASVSTESSSVPSIYVGGLVGTNEGTISNCYVSGNINVKVTSTAEPHKKIGVSALVGGLAGYMNGGMVTDCYAMVEVTSNLTSNYTANTHASGLIGRFVDGILTSCYATGNVSATSKYSYSGRATAGGLAAYSGGTLTNCYATGNVSSTIAGSSLSACYAYVGGLVGNYDDSEAITNCYRYADQVFSRKIYSNVYSTASNDLGTLCSLAQLNSASFYLDTVKWDSEIWNLTNLDFSNDKYPTLK